MSDRNEMDNNLVDLDFSANSEMNRIRENERIEYERRKRHASQLRRAELIRRKKAERIKKMIIAWGVLIFAVIAVIALVIGIVSLFSGNKNTEDDSEAKTVSQAETDLLKELSAFEGAVFAKDNTEEQYIPSAMNSMYAAVVASSVDPLASPVAGSYLSMITDTYMWNSSDDVVAKVKQIIRDYPVYSNGYVWSSEKSMRSPEVSSYLYDTNAAYVSAVCDVCLWEGDTLFLDSKDVTGEENGDITLGMTVGEKLDKAVSHFFDFDGDTLNGGGVRYNSEDGLVYVLTADNNGTNAGKPSNLFYNYRFGYIDTYNNLVFNAAMNDLAALYTLADDSEKAQHYLDIAKKNKEAINEKLFDKRIGRFVGCVDKEGNIHDGGFTVINLMAVSTGVADEEKAQSILSWVEGETTVKADSHQSPNVYNSLASPAFSTVEAVEEWWFNAGGNYSLDDEAVFGEYWLNGAPSVLAGNHYLLAGKTESDKDVAKRAYHLANSFNEGAFALPSSEKSEPSLFYALFASNAVKETFGVSTDGKNLCIKPILKDGENAGINNISFSRHSYDVLFHKDVVYVTSDEKAAVRLKIGGFDKNEMLVLTTVENGIEIAEESVSADKKGVLSVSKKIGGDTYIRVEKDLAEE